MTKTDGKQLAHTHSNSCKYLGNDQWSCDKRVAEQEINSRKEKKQQ